MDVDKLHNEVLRAFNDSCVMAARQPYRGRGFRPAADAYFEEDTREIVVRFELTGLAMDDIELLVDRRELVVRGERAFPTARGPRLPAGRDGLRARSSVACASWSTSTPTSPRRPTRPACSR